MNHSRINNQKGALHIGAAIFAALSVWSTIVLIEDRLHIEKLNVVVEDQASRLEVMELRMKVLQLRQ